MVATCHSRLKFENDIVTNPKRSLAKIASSVGLTSIGQDEIEVVERRVNSLQAPTCTVDQVNKMWPSHKGSAKRDKEEFNFLLERFPEYAEFYEYK